MQLLILNLNFFKQILIQKSQKGISIEQISSVIDLI